MKRCRLDANVILRFLRNDDEVKSRQARQLMVRAESGERRFLLSILTVAEVFYALRASYKLGRSETANALLGLVESGVLEVEREATLIKALGLVIAANVDLGDAMLAAEAAATGDEIATFDQDFARFDDVELYSWSR